MGQLGQGPGGVRRTPGQVALPSPAIALSMHFDHACAIGMDRVLRCWGHNLEGQLGLDDGFPGPDHNTPAPVAGGGQWKAVSAAQGHTCALRTDGTLWCWGRNSPPELGQPMGAPQQLHLPTQVGTDGDWAEVHATQNSSCALKASGALWCWGAAYDAPIGDRVVYTPERVGTDTDWRSLSLETFALCGLKTSGAQWCWGRNDEGQLGDGDVVSVYSPVQLGGGPWSAVAMGRFHHCAIAAAGALYCTGANDTGQLGLGDTDRRNVLTPVRF
jgi:alpha-tubulin suppressor-like RCC1 family protein